MNPLVELLQNARYARRWSFGDLATALGKPKAAARLADIEHGDAWDADLYARAADALDIERAEVERIAEEVDRKERERFEKWVSEPVAPELYWWPFAGVVFQERLPPEIASIEELLEYGRKKSESRYRVAIAIDRRVTVYFESGKEVRRAHAKAGRLNVPYMMIGGRGPAIFSRRS